MNARFRKRATGNVTARVSESPETAAGDLTRRPTGNVVARFQTRNQGT